LRARSPSVRTYGLHASPHAVATVTPAPDPLVKRAPVSSDLGIVLLLLGSAILLFAINKPRMDAVALLALTVLPFTGVITMDEALAGFSDSNIVLIAALFVIGEGLVRTGVARTLGDLLVEKAGGNETRLLVLLMLAVGGLGAVMSSTGGVASLIPVGLR